MTKIFNHSAFEVDDQPVGLHRRGSVALANANDEANWTILNNFGSAFEQAFAPAYVIMSLLSGRAFNNYSVSVKSENNPLTKNPPTDFIQVEWNNAYTRNLKDIEVGAKETVLTMDIFPDNYMGEGVQISTGGMRWMDSQQRDEITEAFKSIWTDFTLNKPNHRFVRKMTDKQFENLEVSVTDPIWDEEALTVAGYADDNYGELQKAVRIEYDFILTPNTYNPNLRDEDTPPEWEATPSSFFVKLISRIIIKNDFIAWGTQHPVERLDKTLVTLWLMSAHNSYTSEGGTGNWPYRAASTKDVVNRISATEKRSRNFLPRVNARGWSITRDGTPYKWPVEYKGSRLTDFYDRTSQILTDFRVNGPQEHEKKRRPMSIQEQLVEKLSQEFNGATLLVDWCNDRRMVVYGGRIEVESIVGTIALDRQTEYHWLESDTIEMQGPLIQISNKLATAIRAEYSEAIKVYDDSGSGGAEPDPEQMGPSALQGQRKDVRVMDLFTQIFVNRGKNPLKVKHLAGLDLDELLGTPTEKEDIALCNSVRNVMEWASKNIAQVRKNARLQEGNFNSWFLWLIETLGTYPGQGEWDAQRRQAMAERNKTRVASIPGELEIPNIVLREGSFEALMPHQAQVLAVDQQDPATHLLDVATGGGKALLIILGTLINKKNKKRRVLLKTLANLIPQMITEINAATNGKVNVVSLRPEHLDLIFRQSRIETVEQFIAWVHGMPENTIFINSYTDEESTRTYFDDLDLSPSYGLYAEETRQYKHLIHMCEFDSIRYDESHTIKNFDSIRSQNAVEVMSRASQKGEATGTFFNNTVLDAHGQSMALNPAIYGDQNHMIDRYGIGNGGVILDKSKARALGDRLSEFVSVSSKRRHDWSYLLPDFREHYAYGEMTELQTEYYTQLMREAQIVIIEDMEKLLREGKQLDEDEMERRTVMLLQAHLAKVEQFLLAPDMVEPYVTWDRKPTGEDLVSPKVRIADGLIRKHIESGKDGKIMLTAYLKVGSVHFMRHSAYSNRFIRYTAGDQQAIQQFRENPDVIGLAADATSMRAGLNLQMTSLLLTLQSPWAPGDDEQLLARAYRPDPRGVYQRDYVDRYWIMARQDGGIGTLDMVKLARMYSKGISNASVANRDNTRWLRMSSKLDELPIIKMLPGIIFNFTNDDAEPYFEGWDTYRRWESSENEDTRVKMAARIEQQHNVKILDENNKIKDLKTFLKHAMVKIKVAPDLPGSKKVWAPWVPYADPPDEHGLGLALIHDADVPIGTPVMTEFGPGKITALKGKSFKVLVSHGEVTLNRSAVAMPETKAGQDRLSILLKQIGHYSVVPPGFDRKISVMKKDDKVVEEAPTEKTTKAVKKVEEAPVGIDAEEIDLEAAVVNGMPCVISTTDSDALEARNEGWKHSSMFIQVSFSSWKYAYAFLDKLDSKFAVPVAHMAQLYETVDNLKAGRMMRATTIPNPENIKNFFLDTKRKLTTTKDRPPAKPYWITWNSKIRLVFDVSVHPPEVIRWLGVQAKRIEGVREVKKNDGFWVKFFKNYRDMKNYTVSMVREMESEGTATFDKKLVSDQLIAAGKLFQEMKHNSK